MSDTQITYFSFTEFCLKTDVAKDTVIEIIEQGIVEPRGDSLDEWVFSPDMLIVTKKAVRLHSDLNVDWPGVALAIDLLDEMEQLREKNRYLESRLSRFEDL